MRLQVPADGGLEVGQFVRVGVEQTSLSALAFLSIRTERGGGGGAQEPLFSPAPPEQGGPAVVPAPPEQGEVERLEVELR